MKKILLFASALAGLFFSASCQQENLEPVGGNTVTYTVQVPDALETKALGDDVSNVNVVHYEVYRTATAETVTFTEADNLLYHRTAPMTAGTATVDLELVNDQNYTVLFWAQVGEENEAYDVDDLTNVTVKTDLYANKVDYAAFAGRDFIVEGKNLAGRTVTLTRPISQINIATTPESLKGNGAFIDDVELEGSSVTVIGLSNTFDVANMAASAQMNSTYEFDEQAVPTETLEVNGKNYTYVAMNYVGFADALGTQVTVSYVINTTEGNIDYEIKNVPVKPNYRTNIVGNLITSTSDYTITLEDEWAGVADEYEIWDGKTLTAPTANAEGAYVIDKPSEWAYLANQQNPVTRAAAPIVIELTSDLDFGGNEITGLVAARNSSLTVNGNGYTILNAKVVSGNNDNGTNAASLFISLPDSELKVENLDVKNVNVITSGANPYAGVITSYVEGTITVKNVNVYNSSVDGIDSIGAIIGFLPANGTATIENVLVDGVKLTNADVEGESGAIGGFVGRVAGKLTASNVKVANTTIEAYVGTDSEQKRSIAKFIGNFVGGGMINVTGASLENVTIVAKNDLAQTQQCLYTEFLGGWRGNGGTVSINGVEITKDQTNEDITIDTQAELAAAISNAANGAVIPVSGEIPTGALNASGKNITIVGMSDDATINSSSNRMHTNGNITFQNLTVTLPTNNDYFGGHDANGGTMVFENCKFVGTATTVNGNFTYNNCEFTNPYKYAAWVYGNSVVTYNNCSFSGPDRAAKVYSDGGSKVEVTYNNCTFKATAQANKTAVEIDCTRQTSGVPYYVTIINPTIENMGVAEHYAVGAAGVCNLETSGVGLGIVNVDGKGYSVAHTAAQLEALAAAGKDVTIELASATYSEDITLTVAKLGAGKKGDVVFKAAEGVSPVIAGAVTLGYFENRVGATAWDGKITFDGITFDHANPSTHSLNIQNLNGLTLKNCTLIGDGEYGISAPGSNPTGPSSIVNCNFINAGLQLGGNFATDLVIDDCTFDESCINVQGGNSVTIQNCSFENTLTNSHVGESFYLVRSNATPITVKNCVIAIDSELAEVATAQEKWGILWNRKNLDWTVENVAVTMTDAALMQTDLLVTKCSSTGKINTNNLTVNGIVQ